MIRKFVLAAAAIAALGTASLAVTATPAAAKGMGGGGFHGHHFHGGGFRVYSGIGLYNTYDSCLRNRWVVNRNGDLVLRTVNVCY